MSSLVHNVTASGAITYWNLNGDFDYQKLRDGLAALSLESFCPEQRGHAIALKHALTNAIASHSLENVLVRGLADIDEDGFVLVREERGNTDNEYETLYHAVYDDILRKLVIEPDNTPLTETIRDEFQKCSVGIGAYQVSRALVLIADSLSGTPLRPAGGIYWLPQDKLSQWEAVSAAVQAAGNGTSKIYQIKTVFDDSAIDALRDSVAHAINSEAEHIAEYAERPNSKSRFLKARQSEARQLHDKVKRWEEVLGLTLQDLHRVADKCEQHVVDVALSAFPDLFNAEFPVAQSAESPAFATAEV